MKLGIKYYLFFVVILLLNNISFAQINPLDTAIRDRYSSATVIEVGEISIEGNKKTKGYIILRELTFKKGDIIILEALVKKFEMARQQLMNTALFHSVIVATKNFEGNVINVNIKVKERWYLFPLPFFNPVDRNLNQWIVEQKASLSRVNYGVKFSYSNATGRNDKIKIGLTNGYTKQISLSYDRPYIDKQLKWGAKFSLNAGKNRETNYKTDLNKQVFYKDEDAYLRNNFNGFAEFTYRKAINTKHSFAFGYNIEAVADTIVALNPTYFNGGRNKIKFPEFNYVFSYYNLDYIPYPTKGYALQVIFKKKGFDKTMNLTQLYAHGSGTWPVTKKSFFNLNVFGAVKVPFKQPFFNQRLLGYGEAFLQGYEYFVIDGAAAGFVKATMARQLFDFNIKIPAKKGKTPQQIPFRIFGKVYGNTGYVHNPLPANNFLSNKMLYSGGFGIDIVTFYDVTFKIEYSFNAYGQNGLFLHRKTIF